MNGYFRRFSVNGYKTKGMFHQFDLKMRECLLTVAIEYVPATISTNRDDLDKQREAKRKKEEMIEKKRMHVIGLGWKQFTITWSSKGSKQSVSELAGHLRMIIREEKRLTPPKDPALVMPKHCTLPTLGTAIKHQCCD